MRDEERTEAARRDLRKLADEGNLSASPVLRAKAKSVRDHFAAADADQADSVELWATRAARGLALLAFVLLAGWLYFRYFQ